MARTKISEFSATAADNTDIDNIDIAEGCAPSGINNAIRELMAQLKDFQTGAAGDPFNGAVNGTVGATTPAAGAFTTLSASSTVSGTGFSNYFASPPAIGGTTPAAGTFTNLAYTGTLTGGTGAINIGSGQVYKDASGNLGIGTSSPFGKLHTYESNGVNYFESPGISSIGLQFRTNSANRYRIGTPSASADLQFLAGGTTETMRLTSDGNLGLGVAPSAWSSSVKALQFDYSAFSGSSSLGTEVDGNCYYNGSNWIYRVTGVALRYNQATSGHSWHTAPSGTAGNAISFTQAMTLDADGNLNLGTGGGNATRLYMVMPAGADRNLILAGITGISNGFQVQYVSGSMRYTLTGLGTGTVSSSSGVLSASSDQNMKIADGVVTSAIDKVMALQPRYFFWKDKDGNANEDQGRQLGFFAQEVNAVIPEASPPPKTDQDGWGIYDRAVVATLTAAIQELKAEFDAYKAAHP